MRKAICSLIIMLVLLGGCQQAPGDVPPVGEEGLPGADAAMQQGEDTPPEWDEITEDGVDEALLLENIDTEDLETVAAKLQELCEAIAERECASDEYVLSAGWLRDFPVSEEYRSVIAMGNKAMKPLYFIIHKSEQQGIYEWLCAAALAEISQEEYEMWATSKDFLAQFNERILESRR